METEVRQGRFRALATGATLLPTVSGRALPPPRLRRLVPGWNVAVESRARGSWLVAVAVGLTVVASGCGAVARSTTVGSFGNAPEPSLSATATARVQGVVGSLIRRGPYSFAEPPIAVWTDFPPANMYIPAYVFVRLNRDLAYNSPSFTLDGVGLALNSGGYTDERRGHCYSAAANVGLIRSGYYVGRIVTVALVIRAARGQPPGYLSMKVPLRPALKQTAGTSRGPDPSTDPTEQYFYLLGCGHVR